MNMKVLVKFFFTRNKSILKTVINYAEKASYVCNRFGKQL